MYNEFLKSIEPAKSSKVFPETFISISPLTLEMLSRLKRFKVFKSK